MVDLKGITRCRRCHGNLFWERDMYGVHLACLQCGAEHPAPEIDKQPHQKLPRLQENMRVPEGRHHLIRV